MVHGILTCALQDSSSNYHNAVRLAQNSFQVGPMWLLVESITEYPCCQGLAPLGSHPTLDFIDPMLKFEAAKPHAVKLH